MARIEPAKGAQFDSILDKLNEIIFYLNQLIADKVQKTDADAV